MDANRPLLQQALRVIENHIAQLVKSHTHSSSLLISTVQIQNEPLHQLMLVLVGMGVSNNDMDYEGVFILRDLQVQTAACLESIGCNLRSRRSG